MAIKGNQEMMVQFRLKLLHQSYETVINPFTPRPSYGYVICHSRILICWPDPIVLLFK